MVSQMVSHSAFSHLKMPPTVFLEDGIRQSGQRGRLLGLSGVFLTGVLVIVVAIPEHYHYTVNCPVRPPRVTFLSRSPS